MGEINTGKNQYARSTFSNSFLIILHITSFFLRVRRQVLWSESQSIKTLNNAKNCWRLHDSPSQNADQEQEGSPLTATSPDALFSLPQKSTAVAVTATFPRSQKLKSHRPSIPWIRMQRNFCQPEKLECIVKHIELKGNFQLPHFNESLLSQYLIVDCKLYFAFRLFLKLISIQHSNDWPSNWACLCSHTFCILPPVGSQEPAVTCTLYCLRWKF